MSNKYSSLNKEEYKRKYEEEVIIGNQVEIRCNNCNIRHGTYNRYFRGYLVVSDFNLIDRSCSNCERRGAKYQLTSNISWITESDVNRMLKREC